MMYIDDPLRLLQKMLEENYKLYKSGEISEKEYLTRVKPIDEAIGKLEMATLRDTPLWKEAFSHCFLKPEH
jgi:hypothetical protein